MMRAGSRQVPSCCPPCSAAARKRGRHFCVRLKTRWRLSVRSFVHAESCPWCVCVVLHT